MNICDMPSHQHAMSNLTFTYFNKINRLNFS